jgi:acetyl-CoA C-acetyltransferase
VDELFMGQVLRAGTGQATARRAGLLAGLPESVPATSIDRVCGSGLKAVMLADQAIRAAEAAVVVAGGMESMSQAPYLIPGARAGLRLGHGRLVDSAIGDGLWCGVDDCHMGTHAEWTAAAAGVSRADQDAFALASHRRAVAAQDAGRFDAELVPVAVRSGREERLVTTDEGPRRDTTEEALARLRPAFPLPEPPAGEPGIGTGTVTAGNAPGLSDGAAALVVAGATAVDRFGLRPVARIVAQAQAETAPRRLFLAPAEAVRRVLDRAGWSVGDVDRFELNEAFAAQAVANVRELGLPDDRVNANGGAIALGHPIGASGARILVTLVHELILSGRRTGVAALCLGGGGSVALAVELTEGDHP